MRAVLAAAIAMALIASASAEDAKDNQVAAKPAPSRNVSSKLPNESKQKMCLQGQFKCPIDTKQQEALRAQIKPVREWLEWLGRQREIDRKRGEQPAEGR
jgi:hypothetical protein